MRHLEITKTMISQSAKIVKLMGKAAPTPELGDWQFSLNSTGKLISLRILILGDNNNENGLIFEVSHCIKILHSMGYDIIIGHPRLGKVDITYFSDDFFETIKGFAISHEAAQAVLLKVLKGGE